MAREVDVGGTLSVLEMRRVMYQESMMPDGGVGDMILMPFAARILKIVPHIEGIPASRLLQFAHIFRGLS